MCKFLILFILILNPFFMYAQECEDEGDSLEKHLVIISDFAKRNGYTKISRQDVSDTFKKFFHMIGIFTQIGDIIIKNQ